MTRPIERKESGAVTRPCPQCGRPVAWGPTAVFRPFCSERCRTIDLAAWAEGRYSIAGGTPPDGADGSSAGGDERTA
ncbi:MAG TPA: DNA gyrase inhibitor YacG [Casimicrobiaceae bacterium]|nr:DNA gyrase inhibitor YacG [Casimicrobiaceae bacterium]